jgi:hypothetical protein
MLNRRTFTSIEKAYAADVIKSTAADVSTSYDQGLPPRPNSGKLTTKDKIKQLQMMLHELEDEVHSNTNENTFQWDDDEDSNDEKQKGEKKPGNIIMTSAQAKLGKELIKLANTYKVPELTFNDKARARRTAYQTWFNKLRTIIAMFAETSQLIQGENIIPFKNIDCIGNRAIFLLIGSRVDAYFQRAIRKYEGKGDQALIFIKSQCASTTADDTHHFHHLFTSLRIKENESATNFFRRFTFARTEAEGVGNTYQEASLVNFVLAGLAMSKNPKYDTAVQLYNLERDGGKTYTLEDVEKKIFAIDEKISRENASCRIAQGNMAMGQRGDSRHRTRRGIGNPRRNGHRKPESANAATDSSTRFINTTCFACGKKGHTASYCPEKKKESKSISNSRKQAEGHVAIGTSDSPSSELVCLARDVMIPYVRPPRSGPAPVITMDLYAREMLDTNIFVSLAIRVDEFTICWERKRALERGQLPSLYEGDLEPMEDGNPLWVLLHNRPFNDLEPRVARIIYPDHRARTIFTEGIIPVLQRSFNVTPHQFPRCYRYWHSLVRAYIERRLENVEQGLQLPVTVGVRNRTIALTFYPTGNHPPALISMGHMQYIIHPTDPDEEFERAFAAISQIAGAHVVRKRDPTIEESGNPADLNNYLPDSGATQHMTPRLADLVDAVEGQNLGVEVADGHVIKCTTTGKIKIRMLDDNGEDLEVTLTDVMYVPGLSRRLFSVSKFARHGFHAMIKKNATTLFFTNNGIESPVTLQSIGGEKALAADLRVHGQSPASHSDERYHYVPSLRNRDHSEGARRLLSLEVLHNRLGHRKCRTLLAASEHHLWGDTGVLMTPEAGCLDCGIATIRANSCHDIP